MVQLELLNQLQEVIGKIVQPRNQIHSKEIHLHRGIGTQEQDLNGVLRRYVLPHFKQAQSLRLVLFVIPTNGGQELLQRAAIVGQVTTEVPQQIHVIAR